MPRGLLIIAISLVLLIAGVPAHADYRVFGFSAADLTVAIDRFNGEAIKHSSELGRAVSVRQGTVRLGKSACPSLTTDPRRKLTRIRVVDTPPHAAVLTRTSGSRFGVAEALTLMGAAGWTPPATAARTRQPLWDVRPATDTAVEFVVNGFDIGDSAGGIDATMASDSRMTFRVGLPEVAPVPGTGTTNLVLALTTELPASRPGRRPKRRECLLVVQTLAVDVQALVDLLAATPLESTTRARLEGMLDEALYWVAHDQPARAARSTRAFALEVARRSVSEVPAPHAEELMTRALAAVEALGF